MRLKSLFGAALCGVAITGVGAGSALAGESTGSGKVTPIADDVAQSICSFSGQNPERFLTGSDFETGRTQSWGQIPKEERDFLTTIGFAPGDSCNGHTGFFAGGGGEG